MGVGYQTGGSRIFNSYKKLLKIIVYDYYIIINIIMNPETAPLLYRDTYMPSALQCRCFVFILFFIIFNTKHFSY